MPPAGPHGPYGPHGPHGPYGTPPPPPPSPRRGGGGLVIGAVILVFVLMLGGGALAVSLYLRGDDGVGTGGVASRGGLDEVRYYDDLSVEHVDEGTTVDYDVFPPVGGPHYPVWQNCGIYDEPLRAEYVVHSQEHGAVWITHDPALPEEQVQALHAHYSPGDYLVISPLEGLPAPVVASAWGSQLLLEEAEDPRLAEYLVEFVQGESTPEPGAPCSGGHDGTEEDFVGRIGTEAREIADPRE